MYWIDIWGLKAELSQGGLSERETLKYILGAVILQTTPTSPWGPDPPIWMHLALLALAALGVLYAYRRNHGQRGAHFAQRYFAISWVVRWRLVPWLFAAVLVLACVRLLSGTRLPLQGGVARGLIGCAFLTILYSRVGLHMRDVARRTELQTDAGSLSLDAPAYTDSDQVTTAARKSLVTLNVLAIAFCVSATALLLYLLWRPVPYQAALLAGLGMQLPAGTALVVSVSNGLIRLLPFVMVALVVLAPGIGYLLVRLNRKGLLAPILAALGCLIILACAIVVAAMYVPTKELVDKLISR